MKLRWFCSLLDIVMNKSISLAEREYLETGRIDQISVSERLCGFSEASLFEYLTTGGYIEIKFGNSTFALVNIDGARILLEEEDQLDWQRVMVSQMSENLLVYGYDDIRKVSPDLVPAVDACSNDYFYSCGANELWASRDAYAYIRWIRENPMDENYEDVCRIMSELVYRRKQLGQAVFHEGDTEFGGTVMRYRVNNIAVVYRCNLRKSLIYFIRDSGKILKARAW